MQAEFHKGAGVIVEVPRDFENLRLASGTPDLYGEGLRIGVAHLKILRNFVDADEFVACGENRHSGLAMHIDVGFADGGELGRYR